MHWKKSSKSAPEAMISGCASWISRSGLIRRRQNLFCARSRSTTGRFLPSWTILRGKTMTEMIERVARAIGRCESSDDWEELGQHWKDQFRQEARAAIAAMREPSETMVDAGDQA